jgi:uncharacterized cupredoxin-like copper-binding protein
MKSFVFSGVALLALAGAQAPAQGSPTTVEIDLTNFKIGPDAITLQHGQPYVLHIVNQAKGGHDFEAKAFFDAATVAAGDRAVVAKGKIELGGGQSADVHLTAPAAGTYEAHCTHFMHSTFGMTGKIVVQ